MKRATSPSAESLPTKTARTAAEEEAALVTDPSFLLDVAVRAVAHASRVSKQVQLRRRSGEGSSIDKADSSPVTVADYAVQCFVTHYVAVATGAGDALRLVAEEDPSLLADESRGAAVAEVVELLNEFFPFEELSQLRAHNKEVKLPTKFCKEDVIRLLQRGDDMGGRSGSFWVLDPIDGTKGFIRDAQYAIGLGLIKDGMPSMSVMACPNLPPKGGDVETRTEGAGCIFLASVLGSQSSVLGLDECLARLAKELVPLGVDWHEAGTPNSSSRILELGQAALCESYEASHRDGDAILPRLVGKGVLSRKSVLRLDSMSKYGLVARGDAHIYLRGNFGTKRPECIWDHAGGILAVTLAGGKVSDFYGKDLDFGCGRTLSENTGIIATAPEIHELLLRELAELRSERDASARTVA